MARSNSNTIRDAALGLAKGKKGKPGWLDVFENGLTYSEPSRVCEVERTQVRSLMQVLKGNPQEDVIEELKDLCLRIMQELEDTVRTDPKSMAIAIDCAKELKGIAVPRMTAKAVDDDPKKNRAAVVPNEAGYLPEDTEEL